MNQINIKIIVTVGVTVLLSLYLGVGAASSQQEVLKVTGAAALLAIIIGFGRRVWLLVPLTMLSSLSFRWMPGQWRAADLAYLVTIFGCSLLFLSRNLEFKVRLRVIHIYALLVVITVLQAYLRNPVGLAVFGSASVGGRAYFTFGIAVMMCVLFSFIRVPAQELLTMRKYAFAGGIFTVIAQWLSYVPGLALPMTLILGTGNMNFAGETSSSGAAGRNMAGMDSGKVFSKLAISYTSPLRGLFLNKWTFVVGFALFGSVISGFRSQVGGVVLVLAIGVFYWQGYRAVIFSMMLGVVALLLLALANTVIPFPAEVQRSLSFLPGSWDERYVREGETSTDWRVEIWEEALTSERWIENKIIGDGLGFSAQELALQEAMAQKKYYVRGFSGLTSHQVSLLINGDYHSGPVSFIRAVGYLGLVIFCMGLLAVLVSCHRLLRSLKGSPYFGVAALICVPAIAHPFIFFFVFGTFSGDISIFFLNIGLICFLRNNIDFENLYHDPREELPEEAQAQT